MVPFGEAANVQRSSLLTRDNQLVQAALKAPRRNSQDASLAPTPDRASIPVEAKNAGLFHTWLESTLRVIRNGDDAEVACGDCSACCNSSYFVHIKPGDTQTLAHVPTDLTFPAPGLPDGHRLLGYDENGRCPMFIDGQCSIYEFRPQTCRQFDCRVFHATSIEITERPMIDEQANRWQFGCASQADQEALRAVQAAARFLVEHGDALPKGFVPSNAAQQAILAIDSYALFLDNESSTVKDTANAIVSAQLQLNNAPQNGEHR